MAYEHAISVDPGQAAYWTGKGSVLWKLDRYEDALVAYDQALALKSQFAYAWKCKIALLRKLKRTAEADEAERQRKAALGNR